MQIIPAISHDPGFGNGKLRANDTRVVIQAAVSIPGEIGDAAAGLDVDEKPPEVRFDDNVFVVGEGSWNWGAPLGSFDYGDLASPSRLAIFYACLAQAMPPGEYQVDRLMIGLPTPLLQDELMSDLVRENIASKYKRNHRFTVDGESYYFDIRYAYTRAQPVGAYYDYILDEEGHVRRGSSKKLVGILDAGMNTLDFYGVQAGKAKVRFVRGSKDGVRRLIEAIDGRAEKEIIDNRIRNRTIDVPDAAIESWLATILGTTEELWPSLSTFDLVIPVGGGAVILGEHLRRALVARRAIVEWPDNPITSIVDGLYKLGIRSL
jgi:hypothetical protein